MTKDVSGSGPHGPVSERFMRHYYGAAKGSTTMKRVHEGTTHHENCWLEHRECAVEKVTALTTERDAMLTWMMRNLTKKQIDAAMTFVREVRR